MRAALSAVLLLAACAGHHHSAPHTADEATEADTCGKARFEHLIGTPADQIDRSTLPPRTRVIMPNSPVTMDFLAERLNIVVDEEGRVGSLGCY